jgi:hypothetical protein
MNVGAKTGETKLDNEMALVAGGDDTTPWTGVASGDVMWFNALSCAVMINITRASRCSQTDAQRTAQQRRRNGRRAARLRITYMRFF